MNLTRFALEQRTATIVFLALLVLAGAMSFGQLPRAEDPGFVIRVAVVATFYPGASAEQVELLVTDPIEEAIEDIDEVDFVLSESRTGASVLEVFFLESLSPEAVEKGFDELRETVTDARGRLPADIIGPNVDDDFGDVFGTVVAITGEGFDLVELERVAERARAILLGVEDVSRVEIQGAQPQSIFVEYDPARLDELGLTALQLRDILRARNIVAPGGDVRSERERFTLEVAGSFESVQALERMRFRLPASGELIALGNIASVRRGTEDPPRSAVSYGGQPALILAISMTDGGKITRLGPRVLAALEAIEEELPLGIETHLVAYQTSYVERIIKSFIWSLLQGVGIVLAVTLIALGLRTGFIVATVLPMTMVGSLLLMELFDITMNQMSLAALIIALGLLVDSAIVMAESIQVAMREGASPVEAARNSASELSLPLLVSSLTTAAALLPTYLAESTTGEYTSAIFEVVTIALLLAWVLALTMTPLLSVLLAGRGGAGSQQRGYDNPFYRRYRAFLLGLVRRRWLSLAGFVALLAVSLWAFQFVPQLFFPRKEQTTFKIELQLPYGSSIERSAEVSAGVERFLAEELSAELAEDETRPWLPNEERRFARHGVVNWVSFIGSGAPRFLVSYNPEQPRTNYVFMIANSSTYDEQDRIIHQVEDFVAHAYPDVLARVEKLRNGPPLDYPVEIRLSGEDPRLLYALAVDVENRLRELPGTLGVGHDWGTYRKKLRVEVDDARARRAGVTERDVALSLLTRTNGFVLGNYREGNDLIPITLRSHAARSDGLEQLSGLDVAGLGAGAVPLAQLASLQVELEPAVIKRRDRLRTLTVHADIDADADRSVTPFSVVDQVLPLLEEASATWPLGYRYELGGEVESSGTAQASIQAKQPIAVLVIISLLVLQFNSIRGPAIVLATLPFTLIGVVGGLVMTQKPFGFMALLGVIALLGVVINNAVVLLDRIETERKRYGRSLGAAVIEASQRRLRPILLTTATTVGGLMPLWLAGGPMFSPMAVALLFGLVASTLLTLGLVPLLFGLFYRVDFDGVEAELAQAADAPVATGAAA
ncbi:MAG: efflux RND transporter permease subunit [Acidobacteriota bacterium]